MNADIVDDAMSSQLASLIAKQIHDQMDYPGKIKVTIIREKRMIASAGHSY